MSDERDTTQDQTMIDDEQESAEEREARLSTMIEMAASGELEAPAGADELVEALAYAVRQRDEKADQMLRTAADFQNFQRRAAQNEIEARKQGVSDAVKSILGAMDHFDLALQQDLSNMSAEQLASGVKVIKDGLLKSLAAHGAGVIEPAPGEAFDPSRHEAIMRQPTGEVEEGAVVATLQAGYTLHDRVVRPAKVSVATTPEGAQPDEQSPGEA
ncbi:MAG: nucleotide exchange factor GrpE [Planctomycetota bacterium]